MRGARVHGSLFAVECVWSSTVIAATNFGAYCEIGGFPMPAVCFTRQEADCIREDWTRRVRAAGSAAEYRVVEYSRSASVFASLASVYVLESAPLHVGGEPAWSPDLAGDSMATCFGCSETGEAVAEAVKGAHGCDRLYRVAKYVRADAPGSVRAALDLAAVTAVRATKGICGFHEAVRIGEAVRRLKPEPAEAEDEALELAHSIAIAAAQRELLRLCITRQDSCDLIWADLRTALGDTTELERYLELLGLLVRSSEAPYLVRVRDESEAI